MTNIIYQSRRLMVSDTLFRTPRRSYKVSQIQKISIKRPFFWFGLPIAAGSYFLLTEFSPYLYSYECIACLGTMFGLPMVTWFIGTLSVTSKAFNNDDAITGFMPSLQKAREALEQVIFNTPSTFEPMENRHD